MPENWVTFPRISEFEKPGEIGIKIFASHQTHRRNLIPPKQNTTANHRCRVYRNLRKQDRLSLPTRTEASVSIDHAIDGEDIVLTFTQSQKIPVNKPIVLKLVHTGTQYRPDTSINLSRSAN